MIKNIYVERSETQPPVAAETGAAAKYRKVNCSPNEEFARRLAKQNVTVRKHFPDAVVAAFFYSYREITITKKGIVMRIGKERFEYWHENSVTCTKVGETVTVAYQLEALDWVAVMNPDGSIVEIVPKKFEAPWFDEDAMREAIRARDHANARLTERFEQLHAPTVEERLERQLTNAERMQIVNVLPIPSGDRTEVTRAEAPPEPQVASESTHSNRCAGDDAGSSERGETEAPRCSFQDAEALDRATKSAASQQTGHVTRERKNRARVLAEEDDFTALNGDGAKPTQKTSSSYAVSMDELKELG